MRNNSTYHKSLAIALCTLSALLLCSRGFSQASSQQTPPKPEAPAAPSLRVMTRLVQVNVIVQDKKGDPVTGLKKEDFTLLDGGQPQHIAFFSEQATRVFTAGAPGAPPAPPPNTFSNRFEEKTGVPTSVTVILLDALNTHFNDMAYARAQVVKFLKQLQPQDRVALYGFNGKVVVLHDFTSDAGSILRALNKSQNTESPQLVASESADNPSDSGDADIDAWLNGANQRVADFYTINRVDQTAEAIEAIANHLSGLPGRKNLIWVSGSFPFQIGYDAPIGGTDERRTFGEEVEAAAQALNNANLAIYPVDARGLIAPPMNINRPGPAGRGAARPNAGRISPAPQNFDTMNILADRTGGRAFYNTNDINNAIRHAVDDSRVTYVIGYYPSHNDWDGKFREIKIESRQSGLHLRYRRGYFAIPDSAISSSQKARMMADAIHTTLESTDLGLDIHADPVDVPGARSVKARVLVSPGQMSFTQSGEHFTDNIEVIWLQLGADGRILDDTAQTLRLNIPRETFDKVTREGLSFSGTVPLKNETTQLRLVARDTGSGAIGSVNIPLARIFGQPPAQTPPKD